MIFSLDDPSFFGSFEETLLSPWRKELGRSYEALRLKRLSFCPSACALLERSGFRVGIFGSVLRPFEHWLSSDIDFLVEENNESSCPGARRVEAKSILFEALALVDCSFDVVFPPCQNKAFEARAKNFWMAQGAQIREALGAGADLSNGFAPSDTLFILQDRLALAQSAAARASQSAKDGRIESALLSLDAVLRIWASCLADCLRYFAPGCPMAPTELSHPELFSRPSIALGGRAPIAPDLIRSWIALSSWAMEQAQSFGAGSLRGADLEPGAWSAQALQRALSESLLAFCRQTEPKGLLAFSKP